MKNKMTEAAFMAASNLARVSDASRILNEVHEIALDLDDTVKLRRMKIELYQLQDKIRESIDCTVEDDDEEIEKD